MAKSDRDFWVADGRVTDIIPDLSESGWTSEVEPNFEYGVLSPMGHVLYHPVAHEIIGHHIWRFIFSAFDPLN